MTWNTPSVPSSAGLVPDKVLELGDLLSGAWRIFRSRIGLFLLLLAIPFGVMAVVSMLFLGGMFASMFSMFNSPYGQPPAAFFGLMIVFYIIMIAVSLLMYVYIGRIMVATLDLATGRENPTTKNLAARTPGLYGRVVVLMLMALGAGLVVGLVVALITVPVGLAADGDGSPVLGLLSFVALMVFYVAMIWVAVRLLYVMVIMAEEGLGAWAAVKRSFALTKGAFWKTLGYQLILGLIIGALMMIPYFIIMAIAMGLASSVAYGGDPTGAIVAGVLALLVLYAVMFLVTPYMYAYTALMYLSRRREVGELPVAAPQWGQTYPGQQGGPYPYPPQQNDQQPPYPGSPGGPPAPGSPQS